MEMKITILTPDILRAAEIMAESLRTVATEAPAKKTTKKTTKKVEPVVFTEPAKLEEVVEEVKPEPVVEEVKPNYTKKQVSLAGGRLIQADASKMPAVQALLTEFDVRAVVDLPDDKLDAFAAKLIELGAVIE